MSGRLARFVPAVTWRNAAEVMAEHDVRQHPTGGRTLTWCRSCRRPPGDYYDAIRHAAALGHLVDVVMESRSTLGTFDALLDAEARREASGR